MSHMVEDFRAIIPELVGGFIGYFIHTLHHAIFHKAHGWLKKLRK